MPPNLTLSLTQTRNPNPNPNPKVWLQEATDRNVVEKQISKKIIRVKSLEAEAAEATAERAKYELTLLEKKANKKRQQLEKEVLKEVSERERVELLMGEQKRSLATLQRDTSKHQRQLDLDRADLVQRNLLFTKQSDSMTHQKKVMREERRQNKVCLGAVQESSQREKDVRVFFFVLSVFARDSLIPLPF
jgi:hypothetical protein